MTYFDFIRQGIVFWKEWYQDNLIWFGSIDSATISWNTVTYELFTAGIIIVVHYIVLSLFCLHGLMGFLATMNGSPKSHYPWLKCHENEEKIENDHVLRNDHRIKTTQPISMILVSFFSEDNVLSDKKAIYLNIKVTKIERSGYFGGTPGTTKTVSSRLTLFDITREIFNQNCSFKLLCMQNFLTHIFSGYSLSILTIVLRNHGIYEIRCKNKKLHFLSIRLWRFNNNAWHGIPAQNSMHTMERMVASLNKSAIFSKHPAQQNWCFDYENNDKYHRMTTQNVRKKIPHALHFKWTILIKYFTSYIKILWSCCGSVDKTTDSQSWGPRFESAGSGSSALGQGTLSSLPSTSERT